MKKLFILAATMLLSVSLFCQPNSTTAPMAAVVYSYHKVKSNQVAGFLANMKVRKKIVEVRKAEKTTIAWMLYEIGNNPEYNYVIVSLLPNYVALENGGNTTSKPAALKVMTLQQYEASTAKLEQTFVKRDFTLNTEGFWKEGANWEHQYVSASFLKTTGEGNYRKLWSEFWLPSHKIRATEDRLQGYQLTQVIRGGGTMHPYDVIAVSIYKNYKQTEPTFDDDQRNADIKKAHPNMTEQEVKDKMAAIAKSRTLYCSELWKLVDMIKP